MIDPSEARTRLLDEVDPLDEESVPLGDSLHRTLTRAVHATAPHPPWDNSAMDGFAVRASDTSGASEDRPAEMRVIGESTAASPFKARLDPGTAVQISTGGPVPEGADAVIPIERSDRFSKEGEPRARKREESSGDLVRLFQEAAPGAHIRSRGEELQPGDEILPAGLKVNPAAIGLLASLGHRTIQVFRRPRVLLLVTGEEFVGSADPTRGGDANGPMLEALCRECGVEVSGTRYVGDETGALTAVVREWAPRVDVILSTGGASVGPHDLVAEAWSAIGAETLFWKVAMKPGKPVRAGFLSLESGRRTVLLALPGNPQSVLAGFETFAQPLLSRLAGHRDPLPATVRVPLRSPLTPHGRTRLLRARLVAADGRPGLEVPPTQGSGMLRQAATCPFVAVVPPTDRALEPGTLLEARFRPEGLQGRSWTPSEPS